MREIEQQQIRTGGFATTPTTTQIPKCPFELFLICMTSRHVSTPRGEVSARDDRVRSSLALDTRDCLSQVLMRERRLKADTTSTQHETVWWLKGVSANTANAVFALLAVTGQVGENVSLPLLSSSIVRWQCNAVYGPWCPWTYFTNGVLDLCMVMWLWMATGLGVQSHLLCCASRWAAIRISFCSLAVLFWPPSFTPGFFYCACVQPRLGHTTPTCPISKCSGLDCAPASTACWLCMLRLRLEPQHSCRHSSTTSCGFGLPCLPHS